MRPSTEYWAQVRQLFQTALALNPTGREAFLSEACAGEPGLRAEVESLLQSNEEVGHSLGPMSMTSELLDEPALKSRRIGAYQLIREIGSGGMGTVYLADRADELYHKRVAIKVIRREMSTPSLLRRFKTERQILASLDHPNIARLLDAGTTDDGLPYFVMEYVEGSPINTYCDSRHLPIDERLRLFQIICSAVHYAHQNLVVHRDLKPKNILVSAKGVPKLVDFGIAKILKPELFSHTADLTASSFLMMTPEYASPEQVRGEAITPASDIYSLGVLLYDLLTGHSPYRLRSQLPGELSRQICEEEPEKPSAAIVRQRSAQTVNDRRPGITAEWVRRSRNATTEQLRRQLRGDLDNIVLKALQKVPQKRYAAVEAFSQDIDRHLQGLPTEARGDPWPLRTLKALRRQRAMVALTLGLALSFIAGAVAFFDLRGKTAVPSAPRSLAVLPLVNNAGDATGDYFSDGITESVINDLSQLPGLRVLARWTSFRFRGRTIDPQAVGRQLGVDAVLSGSALEREGNVTLQAELISVADGTQLWGERYVRPIAEIAAIPETVAMAIADRLGLQLTEKERRRLVRRHTTDQRAYQAYLKGRYFLNKRNEADLHKALEYFHQAIEIDPSYALAYAGIAHTNAIAPGYGWLPDDLAYPRAEAAARRALEIDGSIAEVWAALGFIKLLHAWDLPGAERDLARALELNPNDASTLHWFSLYFAASGRTDEAVVRMQRALGLDPLSPIINANLGRVLFHARRYSEAIEQSKKALELEPGALPARYTLGRAYAQIGRYAEAVTALKGGDSLELIAPYAFAVGQSGDVPAALEAIDRIKQRAQERQRSMMLAFAYAGLRREQETLDWLERAYVSHEDWMIFLNVDPELDFVRDHSRFKELLGKMKLEPLARKASDGLQSR